MMKKFIKIMPRMVIENIDFNKLSKDDLESLLIISIILIHCDAGISRSAAVAKALSLWYHKDGSRFDNLYLPNPMIFKIMNQTIERMDKNEESKHWNFLF